MDPTDPSNVPRGVIPAMEEIGLGSGVGSDGGFDLSGPPVQPVEQRFVFPAGSEPSIESGAVFRAPIVAARQSAPNGPPNFAGSHRDPPPPPPPPAQTPPLHPLL